MEIDVEDGRMVCARPDGSVSPYGAYLCPKGMASGEFHNGAENRLLHSLKRQAGGSFAAIDMCRSASSLPMLREPECSMIQTAPSSSTATPYGRTMVVSVIEVIVTVVSPPSSG